MIAKKSDTNTIEFDFLKKYIREDDKIEKEISSPFLKGDFGVEKKGQIEIVNSAGEGISYSNTNPNNNISNNSVNFNKNNNKKYMGSNNSNKLPNNPNSNRSNDSSKYNSSNESRMSNKSYEKTEFKSPITAAKKEFFDQLEDESLTLDSCNRLNKDWNKK